MILPGGPTEHKRAGKRGKLKVETRPMSRA